MKRILPIICILIIAFNNAGAMLPKKFSTGETCCLYCLFPFVYFTRAWENLEFFPEKEMSILGHEAVFERKTIKYYESEKIKSGELVKKTKLAYPGGDEMVAVEMIISEIDCTI